MAETDNNYSAPAKSGFRSSRYPGFIGGKVDSTSGNLQFGSGTPAAESSPTISSPATNGLSSARIRRPLPQSQPGSSGGFVDGIDKPRAVYRPATRTLTNNYGVIDTGKVGRWALTAASSIPGPIGAGAMLAKFGINANNVAANDAERKDRGVPLLSTWDKLGGAIGWNDAGRGGIKGGKGSGTGTGGVKSAASLSDGFEKGLGAKVGDHGGNVAFGDGAQSGGEVGGATSLASDNFGFGGGAYSSGNQTESVAFGGGASGGGLNAGYNPGDVASETLSPLGASNTAETDSGGGGGDGGTVSGNFGSDSTGGIGSDSLGTDSGGGSSSSSSSRVICTQLVRMKVMASALQRIDAEYTATHISPATVRGYHLWAVPYVRMMRRKDIFGRIAFAAMEPIARWRAEEIACRMGRRSRGSIKGKIVRAVIEPLCFVIGLLVRDVNWKKLYITEDYNA